jgi:hypothetical protein
MVMVVVVVVVLDVFMRFITKGSWKPSAPPNLRRLLYENWARWSKWYKLQPLDHIKFVQLSVCLLLLIVWFILFFTLNLHYAEHISERRLDCTLHGWAITRTV